MESKTFWTGTGNRPAPPGSAALSFSRLPRSRARVSDDPPHQVENPLLRAPEGDRRTNPRTQNPVPTRRMTLHRSTSHHSTEEIGARDPNSDRDPRFVLDSTWGTQSSTSDLLFFHRGPASPRRTLRGVSGSRVTHQAIYCLPFLTTAYNLLLRSRVRSAIFSVRLF